MIQELYRLISFVAICFFCLILASFQSVFLRMPALSWLEIDLLLLVVVYVSYHRGFLECALFVAVIGRIAEIHSATPAGILSICYLAVFLTILFSKGFFLVATSFSTVILAIAGGLVWKIVFLVLAGRYGFFDNVWHASLEYTIPYLLAVGILSRPMFSLLRRIDQLTHVERESTARDLTGEEFQ
jgi:hypothetical protein